MKKTFLKYQQYFTDEKKYIFSHCHLPWGKKTKNCKIWNLNSILHHEINTVFGRHHICSENETWLKNSPYLKHRKRTLLASDFNVGFWWLSLRYRDGKQKIAWMIASTRKNNIPFRDILKHCSNDKSMNQIFNTWGIVSRITFAPKFGWRARTDGDEDEGWLIVIYFELYKPRFPVITYQRVVPSRQMEAKLVGI